MTAPGRSTYLRPGFALALALRLLTSSLAIVVPLYATSVLGAAAAEAGAFVVLLWVGNAAGVMTATVLIRDQSTSSVAGFVLLGASAAVLASGTHYVPFWLEALGSGVGMGLPQPFLSAFMHLESRPEKPFRGIGLYSTALGVGLVLGPLLAYGALELFGFDGVFGALALVCVLGAVGAIMGASSLEGRPRPPAPSPARWGAAFRKPGFRRAFTVNFFYALLLPVFLSYGAISAEARFGFSAEDALLLFAAVFLVSTGLRILATSSRVGLSKLLLASTGLLLASTLCLGLASAWPLFVFGMVLFSLPHAMVYPISSYFAFSSVNEADVVNASYAFQASSGVAELLAPAAAVLLIPSVGVQGVFLLGAALAATAFVVSATKPR
ncbi:MAG: MFS transporter [Nitrososphaerota archaeon]|nr:MFS transporter [Nitrososphaerota archaeon]